MSYHAWLADCLQNTAPDSGASVDYGKGIVLTCVAALMGNRNLTFSEAVDTVCRNLPNNYRKECIPDVWAKDFEDTLRLIGTRRGSLRYPPKA